MNILPSKRAAISNSEWIHAIAVDIEAFQVRTDSSFRIHDVRRCYGKVIFRSHGMFVKGRFHTGDIIERVGG